MVPFSCLSPLIPQGCGMESDMLDKASQVCGMESDMLDMAPQGCGMES